MNIDNYIALIYKKLKGDISLEEQSHLDIWIGQDSENETLANQLETDWQLSSQYEADVDLNLDVEGDFKLLQQRIQIEESLVESPKDKLRVANQPIGKVVQLNSKKSTGKWIAWASAAVVALAVGFWFMNNQDTTQVNMLALETQFKQKKEVELPDGTKVYLNQDSKLAYPSEFIGENRLVTLTGEAFFEVAKNAQKPFIIETNKAKVTVLGTSFNVRAKIADAETEVVVKTGKVRLENTAGDKKVELEPNQKGIYNASDNTIDKLEEKDMNELAWHSDKLVFTGMPLDEVVEVLEEVFGVKINVQKTDLNGCPWDGFYKTQDGIERILNQLVTDMKMTLKPIGNTTYELIGGTCQK